MTTVSYTVEEALQNVDLLEEMPLPDEQPNIEPMPAALTYSVNFDTRFEDRRAYVLGSARYIEEAEMHAAMQKMLEQGEQYAVMLYTWRSCSRAIPAVKANEQPNRTEIYEKTVEVLEPEIKKLHAFYHFAQQAVDEFMKQVSTLCHVNKKNDFVSEAYLLTLGRFMNMFAVLDALKNIKASVKNDYSAFRRAGQFLKRFQDQQASSESQALSLFLASHDQITQELKKKLRQVQNYEDLMLDIINICMIYYEEKRYLVPEDKHMLLKVIGFGLNILDNPDGSLGKKEREQMSIYKMESKKKINLGKIDKIFKDLQVVTLFGDMQITLSSYIRKMSDFKDNESKWTCTQKTSTVQELPQYNLVTQLRIIKDQHIKFISKLSLVSNRAVVAGAANSEGNQRDKDVNCKEHYDLALEGLKLLSRWTATVMEVYSWKLVNPCDTEAQGNKSCPKDAEDYERATRYNYNSKEKFALVEIIGMIKGLQVLMSRLEQLFRPSICWHVYQSIQNFVQKDMREPLRAAAKKKRMKLKIIITSIMSTCADYKNGEAPKDDPAFTGAKDPKQGYTVHVPRRQVGPSSTQLYMIRTMLESMIMVRPSQAKNSSAEAKQLRTSLDSTTIDLIEKFHKSSLYFKQMLSFTQTLTECCDLSQLWFREYYLELTMGKRIQFPIEMSLPWILTDHVLESKNPGMIEFVLQPLDLYSDSGHFALTKFRKQFLYDEIEAEVNLCFDQFVFKISEQIFDHYKCRAAAMILDMQFQLEANRRHFPRGNRYETLLQQRHIQILGRSIDLCRLITQRVTQYLQQSIAYAIDKFESTNLTGIIELDHMIEVNRMTHKLLSEYLHLDPFDNILHEANQSVSGMGRITGHVIWELNYDFLPNFNYNNSTERFVKSEMIFSEETKLKREKAPKTEYILSYGSKELNRDFDMILSPYSGFVGRDHFKSIVKLLGYSGIAWTVKECVLETCKSLIQNTIHLYLQNFKRVFPESIRTPKVDYGTAGVFQFYQNHLRDFLSYQEKSVAIHYFREVGNALVFVMMLERALNQEEMYDMLQSAPFRRQLPKFHVKPDENYAQKHKLMERKYENLDVVSISQKYGTTDIHRAAEDGDIVSGERLCCGLSLFGYMLRQIKSCLSDPIWRGEGAGPPNGVMYIDKCAEFQRIWSGVQWYMCLREGQGTKTPEALFGDGPQFCALAIINLLGQENRFNAFDFCNHFVKVVERDREDRKQAAEKIQQYDMNEFLQRILRVQKLNTSISNLLSRFHSSSSEDNSTVQNFAPPTHKNYQNI